MDKSRTPNNWFGVSRGVCLWKVLWKFENFPHVRQASETLNVKR